MDRTRIWAAGAFSAVILIVLTIIVYVETINSSKTVSVYVIAKDVAAGAAYTPDTVQLITIKAGDHDFAFEQRTPADFPARYALQLHVGDIVRDDDLVPANAFSEISLTIGKAPVLAPGDSIDVYALQGDAALLVGYNMKVVSGSGPVTILAPTKDEPEWVAISGGANVSLLAVKSAGGPPPAKKCLDLRTAIGVLSGVDTGVASTACNGAGAR